MPPLAVPFEASGQGPDARAQGDHRHRLQRIDGMLLSEHLAHPGLQMTNCTLQRSQVSKHLGTHHCGQLASGPPAAEYLHGSAQYSLSQGRGGGVGGR